MTEIISGTESQQQIVTIDVGSVLRLCSWMSGRSADFQYVSQSPPVPARSLTDSENDRRCPRQYHSERDPLVDEAID